MTPIEALVKKNRDLAFKHATDWLNFHAGFENYLNYIRKEYHELAMHGIKGQGRAATFKTRVGAAVQSGKKIYSSGNIENLSRMEDEHAEALVMKMALMDGCTDPMEYRALALVYGEMVKETDEHSFPACNICRQIIWENANPETVIINVVPTGEIVFAAPLRLLYPFPYPNFSSIPRRLPNKC